MRIQYRKFWIAKNTKNVHHKASQHKYVYLSALQFKSPKWTQNSSCRTLFWLQAWHKK